MEGRRLGTCRCYVRGGGGFVQPFGLLVDGSWAAADVIEAFDPRRPDVGEELARWLHRSAALELTGERASAGGRMLQPVLRGNVEGTRLYRSWAVVSIDWSTAECVVRSSLRPRARSKWSWPAQVLPAAVSSQELGEAFRGMVKLVEGFLLAEGMIQVGPTFL